MVGWRIIMRDGSQHPVTGSISLDIKTGKELVAGTLVVTPEVLEAFYDGVFQLQAPNGRLHSAVIDKLDGKDARLIGTLVLP